VTSEALKVMSAGYTDRLAVSILQLLMTCGSGKRYYAGKMIKALRKMPGKMKFLYTVP
jgi:hypothetical protein